MNILLYPNVVGYAPACFSPFSSQNFSSGTSGGFAHGDSLSTHQEEVGRRGEGAKGRRGDGAKGRRGEGERNMC